jgi:hypothetical protein
MINLETVRSVIVIFPSIMCNPYAKTGPKD